MKPLGNTCNLACTYCYEEPMRLAGNIKTTSKYDINLMMAVADEGIRKGKAAEKYVMFGGEALLTPKKDLEIFFKASHAKYGGGIIQTNAALIDDEHIEIFKKYNVHVGVSLDGPGELNAMRVPAAKGQDVNEVTKKTIDNIYKLHKNNIDFAVIMTVHKLNGTGKNIDILLKFIQWLDSIGCKGGNLHMLEIDSEEAEKYALTKEENEQAFLKFADFFEQKENRHMNYYPFSEMKLMLYGKEAAQHCVFQSCDPLDTNSVYGVEGNGQVTNCGMVNKEGIDWTKSEDSNILFRDIVLYQTPEEYGGCKGCPWFIVCNGYCPGSSINSDWRNKTMYCSSLKKMFSYYDKKIESEGKVPFSKRPDRQEMEQLYLEKMLSGSKRLQISELFALLNAKNKEKRDYDSFEG